MKSQIQVSAEDEARRCRELDAVLAVPAERAFALDMARAFDELANGARLQLPKGANASIITRSSDHAIIR